MKTLADEILEVLPSLAAAFERGPRAADIAAHMLVGEPFARAACKALDASGRALYVRYPASKARHLLPLDGLPKRHAACAWCRVVFERLRKSKALCCCRAHSNAWTWTRPGQAELRSAAIREAKATPEAKAQLAAHNARRWANPEEHEKLSEQNRRQWADPVAGAKRAAAIQAVAGSPAKRKERSELRLAMWQDPTYRQKCSAAMREAKNRPEVRAKFSEAMKARWADPVLRAKYTAANRARNAKRAKAEQPA